MTTSSQLPAVQNIELFKSTATSVAMSLGYSVPGTLTASARLFSGFTQEGSNILSIPVSVTNYTTGAIVLSFSANDADALRNGAAWDLKSSSASSIDPPELIRTLLWGRIAVATPGNLSSNSQLYHAVEMVSGDEFTFQVNLGTSVSGVTLAARLLPSSAGGFTNQDDLNIPVRVVSASEGVVSVTIDETASGWIRDTGWGWMLTNASTGAVLRAGPVNTYTRESISRAPTAGVGETTVAPKIPNLGSVFL